MPGELLAQEATKRGSMRGVVCAALCGFFSVIGFQSLPARGASLDLGAHPPDISAAFITTEYNATTGEFIANGWPTSFNLNGTSTPNFPMIAGGLYSIDVKLTPTGQPVAGSLDITGEIPNFATSGTLLTGQISQFGYQSGGGNIFEFVFNVTGGDLAPYYDGETNVILDATGSGFNGSFAEQLSSNAFLKYRGQFRARTLNRRPLAERLGRWVPNLGMPPLAAHAHGQVTDYWLQSASPCPQFDTCLPPD